VTGSEAPHRLPTAAKVNLAALAILAAALVVHLWPEWSHDADLSHGFLAPVACGLLVYLCLHPGARGTLPGRAAAILTGSFGAAALAGLWTAGLFAVTLDWTSPLVDFTLACSFALLGFGAIAAFADRRVALVPFSWACLAAAALWPLCSPIPPGTYSRLTSALQLWVSGSVMRTLGLLGVAAHREGNIIELARGTVGIEEACSGVRSLISCVFAGVLFSAALTRKPWARVLIIAVSAPLALAMNFVRSLTLTLLVNGGVHIEGAWHDATGYSVLAVTAAILVWLAVALDRGSPAGATAGRAGPLPRAGPGTGRIPASQAVLLCVLAAAAATLVFFTASTGSPAPSDAAAPRPHGDPADIGAGLERAGDARPLPVCRHPEDRPPCPAHLSARGSRRSGAGRPLPGLLGAGAGFGRPGGIPYSRRVLARLGLDGKAGAPTRVSPSRPAGAGFRGRSTASSRTTAIPSMSGSGRSMTAARSRSGTRSP
jgi:exosortase